MKYTNAIAMSGAVLLLAGCATASKVVVQEPVGPCHRVATQKASEGSLQVYSAWERTPLDVNLEEFWRNNDFGKNEFLYDSSHSGYTIFAQDGRVIKHVRNSQVTNREKPAQVQLPPANYTVEAEAEVSGGMTLTVMVPVVVEAGQVTRVHLEPRWTPSAEGLDPSRLVRLADGRVIGCRSDHLISQDTQLTAPLMGGDHLAGKP